MNYVSGAKLYVELKSGDSSAFSSRPAGEMMKGIKAQSQHVPSQAPPLMPLDLKRVCLYLDMGGIEHHVCKTAILIGFFSFLRQSNLLSVSPTLPSMHTLRRRDIWFAPEGLQVLVSSSKTE